MLRYLSGSVILIFLVTAISFSQTKKLTYTKSDAKLLTALIKAKNVSGVFGDDGMMIFFYEPQVQRILKLRARAFPLLIAHLNDKRVMPYIGFNVSRADESVTMGDVCFDLLVRMVRLTSKLFDMKCEENEYHDSVYDCLKDQYSDKKMKRNWLRAYQKGWLKFDDEILENLE